MARSLEEIAANTRQGLSKKATGTHGGQAQATGNSAKDRAPSPLKETALPGRRKKTTSTHSILSASNSEGRQAEPKPTSERTPVIVQASDSPTRRLPQEGLLSGSHSEGKPTESGGSAGKTKSQESLERAKSESANKAQAQTIADTLKQNLAKWDGTVANGDGDAEEAAGLAVGGPVYTAIKEVTGVLESKDEDDNSLFGVLKKSIADKTGITAVKEKAESAKEGLKDRIRGWAGKQDAAQVEEEKAKRDKEGRFTRPAPNTAEKEQTELATLSFDLAQRESKESKKRHQELVRAVRSVSGGGLLDNMLDGWTGRGGRGRNGKDGKPGKAGRFGRGGDTGRTKGKPAAPKGRLARMGSRLGGLGSKALAAGAGILGVGSLFGGAVAAPAGVAATSAVAASTVARSAAPATTARAAGATGRGTGLLGKAGTMVGKAGSLAGKGLAGAARAIPVFGQLLAAGMAIKDGVQGWNDTEMHQSAFGLAEGEEASTGQKASAAAANVLDMGGLLTGLAGLAGFEIDTADIASGIYTASTAITSTVTEAWGAVGSTISTASATAGAAIAQAWDTASTGISEAASGAWDAITGAATSAWDKASTAVAETATEAWDSVTEGTAKAWDSASSAASSAIAITGEAVSSAWDSASATASGALTAAGDAVSSAWDSTSSTVGGAATSAWDSVSSGASAAWSGVTGFFSGDKPEERAPEKSEATTITQAVAAVPATTLLGEQLPSPAQAKPGDKKEEQDEGELGVDAVIVPDEKMEGLFGTLTTAVSELGDTIKDEIKRKELENGGMFSAVGGLVSGVSTWMKDRLSNTGGGGGSSRSGGGGGSSSRYTYDPNAKIGEAIAKYESGTSGSMAIGYDPKGGTSYGKYQLASNAGSMEGFLKMMEGKGGEHAAIAARLRAAGPANTGSKNGEMPEQWKKEASVNGELLKAAELEYMLKNNYAPAMERLKPELLARVEGSKALQEALFSTSVQHGGYHEKKGAAAIWNKVYRADMSDEDFIRAMYNERATRFGSSPAQIQTSGARRMVSEQELIVSMLKGENSAQATAAAIQNSPQDQAIQAASSSLIQGLTQDAMNRGVGYDFNSTNSQSGATNCSGWITELNTLLMEAINASAKREVFGPEAKRALSKGGTAAGIIQSVSEATGGLLSGDALAPENVTEGMMIGLDASASAGADRFKGIDHIVQTFRDPKTGQMMVSESSSGDIEGKGRNGVMETPYATWHEHQTKKGRAMYGADPTKLADASVLAETAVGANQPAAQTIAGTAPAQTAQAPAAEAQQVAAAAAVQPQGIVPATVAAPIAAAVPNPRPQTVESVGDIAPPDNTGSNTMQTAGIEKLLQGILAVLTQQGKNSAQAGGEGPPHINMDFDDQTALGLAHDRA